MKEESRARALRERNNSMKTVVIWDEMQGEIKFFVVDQDLQHLDGTYINGSDDDKKLDQLNEVLGYDDNGKPKVTLLTAFPMDAVKEGAAVIVCGFLP